MDLDMLQLGALYLILAETSSGKLMKVLFGLASAGFTMAAALSLLE